MAGQKYPHPICGGLIFNPAGKIFLMKSHKWKDKFVVPGGHVEPGEKIKDSLIREIKEETGLDIFDIKYINFQEYIFGDEFWKKRHFIFFDFICKTDSNEVKLNSEAQDYVWVSIKEALKMAITPYARKAIENYLELKK